MKPNDGRCSKYIQILPLFKSYLKKMSKISILTEISDLILQIYRLTIGIE